MINKYRKHMQNLCNVECSIFDIRQKDFTDKNGYCNLCSKQCDYKNTHLYGCYEAQRWDNKYIYYCPLGYIFVAITVVDNMGIADFGVIAGPIIMGDMEEYHPDVPVVNMSAKKVNDLSEIMHAVFSLFSKQKQNDQNGEKAVILNDIYKVIDEFKTNTAYPIELEKQLQTAIAQGDAHLSKKLLNKLLGHIFFQSNGNLEIIKTRVSELIVLLSRSAIDGGAKVSEIFNLNSDYIKEIENFTDLESLSIWLTNVINRFIGYVFDFTNIKHTDALYKVIAFINDNYAHKISIDDIANYVYLSKSYLSKIFKEEMDINLTTYINKVRIEKSKIFLLDKSVSLVNIANMVGFDDQSYYTKVFKQFTGMSPGKYREKHNKE